MFDIQPFIEWANQGNRSIKFEHESEQRSDYSTRDNNTVWVYDYDLMVGDRVKSVEEINLQAGFEKQLAETLARMQKIEEAQR